MHNTKVTCVEWYFGYGGNHLALKRIFPNLFLVAACEIEAYALEAMAEKMESNLLDTAPIWTDCRTFPTEPFKDRRLDIFAASYPCQGESNAGKREGKNSDKWLWPYCASWEKPRTIVSQRGLVRANDGNTSRMDPNRNRIDRLRLIGNGVVPQTAEKAFIKLYSKITEPRATQSSF